MGKQMYGVCLPIMIFIILQNLRCYSVLLNLRWHDPLITHYNKNVNTMLRKLLFFTCIVHCLYGMAQSTTNAALITDASQLSSPFTEPTEGQYLSALLDGDTYTYWHSLYTSTDQSDVHWIEVALNEPISGYLKLYVHRRVQASNDHPTKFVITASTDGYDWVEIDTVETPYTGKDGVFSDFFQLEIPYSYLRLSAIDCHPSYRKLWHAAEIQLYYLGNDSDISTNSNSLRINEVQVANIDQYIDPSYNYGSWIELQNIGESTTFLNEVIIRHTDADGITEDYSLGIDHGFIAANDFITLWFDHHSSEGKFGNTAHLNIPFKLDTEGGKLEIVGKDGNIADAVTYPPAISRCSFARKTDGAGEWGLTAMPTPGASNSTSIFATQRLAAPIVSLDSKVFRSAVPFSVTIPEGTTLRYTTDGSTPTMKNGEISTDGQFYASETTIYRFVLVADGWLPSKVVTRTFIKDENATYYLPILSISTHHDNLFSDEIGLYTKGTNGISGNGQSTACNWNMDWERPVNMEYFVPENGMYKMVLNQECEFKISGGFSRAYGGDDKWQMKSSFTLKSGKLYEGLNSFDYPLFEKAKAFNKYKVFKVRNGGNDTFVRLTDAAFHEIYRRSNFNINYQCWQPAHIFMNGEYLGMLNLREANNKYFAEGEYGIDTDDVDQFELNGELGYEQKTGSKDSFMNWLNRTKELAIDPTNEALWQAVCEVVDVDEFCNYMAAEIYMGGGDWLTNSNNIKGFANPANGGKYHLVMFDLDSTYGSTNMIQSVFDLLHRYDHRYADNNGVSYLAEILFNMLQYEPFKKQFIDAFCIVAGSVLEPARCKEIIDEMANYTAEALKLEGHSPQSVATQIYNKIADTNGRTSRHRNLQNFFSLPSPYGLKLNANVADARLLIGGQEVPTRKFDGYLFAPITLTAKAPAGYTFEGWNLKNAVNINSEDVVAYQSKWSYYDKGSLDNTGWINANYNDASWLSSLAPFGYGTVGTTEGAGDYQTTLDYGDEVSNKRPTYYFRTSFDLPETPRQDENYSLEFYVDDGVIFYVNGVEVGNYNCPAGATYSTYALSYSSSKAFTGKIEIPSSLLQAGKNIIAAEVHNSSGTSSDIFFDTKLCRTTTNNNAQANFISRSETIELDKMLEVGTYEIVAVFSEIADKTQRLEAGASPIRINEVGAGNDIFINDYFKKRDWVELYNTTDEDIDLEGMYLSDNRTKPQKYRISAAGSNASTIIPAKGYRIIWCDNTSPLNQLHANFKLDNADGACVTLQAADGTWSDEMQYLAQDALQTYGRYPDGGYYAALFDRASIGLPNQISTYQFNQDEPEGWTDPLLSTTLQLKEGWNWISHNLQESVNNSRFTTYATALQSQSEKAVKAEEGSWTGTLPTFQPTDGYKVQMAQPTDITLRGKLFDVQTPIKLEEGWNWIGFPLYNATTLDAATTDFIAHDGDAIVGKEGFSVYENGAWSGTLTSLTPGRAYMMYVSAPQTFCWTTLTPSTMVQKSRAYSSPNSEPTVPTYDVNLYAHPNVSCAIATVRLNGGDISADNYVVAAFAGDECRGVSETVDGLFYINLHGNNGETLHFVLQNEAGEEITLRETVDFAELQLLGSRQEPLVLTAQTTDLNKPTTMGATPIHTAYYNLNGQLITTPTSGFYLQRTTYDNGVTITKKIILP